MKNNIEFKRGSLEENKNLKEVYVLNHSDPVFAEDESYITPLHIKSAIPQNDSVMGPSIILNITKDGMDLLNKVACNDKLPILILFINGASFIVYRGIHKLEKPIAIITVMDMDFAAMVQTLINVAKREEEEGQSRRKT